MCKSIYKFLSHHYILRRSVVLIVDSQFDSVIYRDSAMKYVRQLFDGLDPEDHFGYISLDETKRAAKDEIILERRSANEIMKERVLRDAKKREIEYVFSQGGAETSKSLRLERALQRAYEWQNTLVPDYEERVNGRVYVGPHKWIVCLLGDDCYAVN